MKENSYFDMSNVEFYKLCQERQKHYTLKLSIEFENRISNCVEPTKNDRIYLLSLIKHFGYQSIERYIHPALFFFNDEKKNSNLNKWMDILFDINGKNLPSNFTSKLFFLFIHNINLNKISQEDAIYSAKYILDKFNLKFKIKDIYSVNTDEVFDIFKSLEELGLIEDYKGKDKKSDLEILTKSVIMGESTKAKNYFASISNMDEILIKSVKNPFLFNAILPYTTYVNNLDTSICDDIFLNSLKKVKFYLDELDNNTFVINSTSKLKLSNLDAVLSKIDIMKNIENSNLDLDIKHTKKNKI